MHYFDYIDSLAWKEGKRVQRLRLDKHHCQSCQTTQGLTVHHRTYDRLGAEMMDDLVTLCWSCHQEIHRICVERGGSKTYRVEEITTEFLAQGKMEPCMTISNESAKLVRNKGRIKRGVMSWFKRRSVSEVPVEIPVRVKAKRARDAEKYDPTTAGLPQVGNVIIGRRKCYEKNGVEQYSYSGVIEAGESTEPFWGLKFEKTELNAPPPPPVGAIRSSAEKDAEVRRITDDITRRIQAGEWSGRFATQRELALEYKINKSTLSLIWGNLKAQGLIETRGNHGTYVKEQFVAPW